MAISQSRRLRSGVSRSVIIQNWKSSSSSAITDSIEETLFNLAAINHSNFLINGNLFMLDLLFFSRYSSSRFLYDMNRDGLKRFLKKNNINSNINKISSMQIILWRYLLIFMTLLIEQLAYFIFYSSLI